HSATTTISSRSLHDALPISPLIIDGERSAHLSKVQLNIKRVIKIISRCQLPGIRFPVVHKAMVFQMIIGICKNHIENHSSEYLRSEEHTSELQSRENLVCSL